MDEEIYHKIKKSWEKRKFKKDFWMKKHPVEYQKVKIFYRKIKIQEIEKDIMNHEEFLKNLVKIEWVERSNCYGCYPFPLFVLNSKNERILSALDFGGNVMSCYKIVDSYIKKEAKEIFFGLDFPKGGDIQNDFVAIFSIIKNQISICALPYNSVNGECYSIINESSHLENILREYKTVTSNE